MSLRGLIFIGIAALATASCSGTNGGNGTYGGGNASPATLVSTCDMICGNVNDTVASCAPDVSLYNTCVDTCNDLNILPASCLNPFLSYLTCVAGTTASVQCGPDGDYVFIQPPQCESARDETLTCNASPGLIQACVALPGNLSCAPGAGSPEFCVGAPSGCQAPSPNPLGIGVYCCNE